jgi:hypothetical protein
VDRPHAAGSAGLSGRPLGGRPLDAAPAGRDNPGVDAPTPLPLRPSMAERDRVARLLRDHSVDGRISIDTFSARVERAFLAQSSEELEELIADVHPPGRLRRTAMRAVAWCSRLGADLHAAWERPRLPLLGLPSTPDIPLILGRARDCDCVIAEPSVSRRHAQLRRDGDRWLLRDLGSRNGTRVNGMRVLEETEVRPGDRVSFGGIPYRLGRSAGP